MKFSAPVDNGIFGTHQRIPPANLSAEQALLGALLANNKAYPRVADYLLPEHFADPWHGRIYAAIQRKIEAGEIADVITLRPQFENEVMEITDANEEGVPRTRTILAPYYLAQLLSSMVGIINAGEYGRVIHDCWLRRELVDVGEMMVNSAFMVDETGSQASVSTGAELATATAAQLLSLADPKQTQNVVTVRDAVSEALYAAERAMMGEKPKSLPSGIERLDQMTGGFRAPQFIVVGARPGMGKTILAQVLALAAARHTADGEEKPGTVALFSMEMGADELGERILAAETGIDGTAIRDGRLTQPEVDRCLEAVRTVEALPLVIDDRAGLTLDQVRMRARTIAARQKLSLVVVDYLQLMSGPPEVAKHGLTALTTYLSVGLKRLAKELKVPVIALSQLSRDLEKREDKRPMLADLRQSGSIEQDADVVMFLFREEYYLRQSEPTMKADETQGEFDGRHAAWKAQVARVEGQVECIIAKQRRGRTGTVHLRFSGATSRIWQEGYGDE